MSLKLAAGPFITIFHVQGKPNAGGVEFVAADIRDTRGYVCQFKMKSWRFNIIKTVMKLKDWRVFVKEFLSILYDQTAIGFLATIDNGKPRVRPWGFMFEENGRLYFSTASTKDVYRQLIAVPFIEYSKTTKDMVWIRISGEIQFDEDVKKKEKVLELIPFLKQRYQSADNPVFKVFYLEHGKAVIDDFSLNPPRLIEF